MSQLFSKTKNIIFDFGGVIINIDYNKPVEAFKKLGITHFESFFSQSLQQKIFDDLDTGFTSSIEFCNTIRKHSQIDASDTQIIDAWNCILLDQPAHRIQMLERLKLKYKIFLLSNTNSIHYPVYLHELQVKYGYRDYNALFTKAYFSFEMGMRKPDKEIFEYVIAEQKLIPGETLFIDDSIQHVEAAKELGIQAILLEKGTDISELLADL